MLRTGRLYYGWVIVLTLCVTETTSWGILYYAYSVFIQPMEAELGWSRAEMTGAFSVALLITGLAALPAGYILDRYGSRGLMTGGSVLGVAMLLAWSQVQSLTAFYVILVGVGLASAATLYTPAFATIVSWFVHQRRQAVITLTLAAGFASTIFIPLAQFLVEQQGWRGALVSLAVVLGALTIPAHGLLLRKAPAVLNEPPGRSTTPAMTSKPRVDVTPVEAIRQWRFWLFMLALAIHTFTSTAMTVHMVPFMTESGMSGAFAASIAGLAGLMSFPTRLIYSFVGNRISQKNAMVGIYCIEIISLIVMLGARTEVLFIIYGVCFGIARSAPSPVLANLIADLYGVTYYGTISAYVSLASTLAGSASPVISGALRDASGGYSEVLVIMLLLGVAGAVCINIALTGTQAQQTSPSKA